MSRQLHNNYTVHTDTNRSEPRPTNYRKLPIRRTFVIIYVLKQCKKKLLKSVKIWCSYQTYTVMMIHCMYGTQRRYQQMQQNVNHDLLEFFYFQKGCLNIYETLYETYAFTDYKYWHCNPCTVTKAYASCVRWVVGPVCILVLSFNLGRRTGDLWPVNQEVFVLTYDRGSFAKISSFSSKLRSIEESKFVEARWMARH